MQSARILQAVALMLIVALAASCAGTREYSSKLFAPRNPPFKDSFQTALRFLETGEADQNTDDWVSTDLIMGRDSSGSTLALDKLAGTLPPIPARDTKAKTDTASFVKDKAGEALVKTKDVVDEPVAKTVSLNGTRVKKTRED